MPLDLNFLRSKHKSACIDRVRASELCRGRNVAVIDRVIELDIAWRSGEYPLNTKIKTQNLPFK